MSDSSIKKKTHLPTGMRAFFIVVLGQAVSFMATGMTRFAITIWVWQETGEATALALAGFFGFAPVILVSPIAGALVDRLNRKFVMMVSDLAAGTATLIMLILYTTGNLEIWHLYVLGAFAGIFESFQWPAFSAAITTMVPKEEYGRANGMVGLAQSLSGIFAPLMAAALLALIKFPGIMIIDIAAVIVAIAALLFVYIPQPKVSKEGLESKGNLWEESLFGFRYILKRKSLFGLQMVFFSINLVAVFGFTVFTPMLLARTGDDQNILAITQLIGGVGGVVGGVLLSTWGGPRKKVLGVLGGMLISSIFGPILLGLGTGVVVWGIAMFIENAAMPILNGSNQAIWQAKVPPDLQGRVFSVRRLIAQITAPFAMVMAGLLADYFFEPAMEPGGILESFLSPIVGTGPGSGMAIMLIISGVGGIIVSVGGYLIPWIRNVEDIMPDHDELKPVIPPEAVPDYSGWWDTGFDSGVSDPFD